LIDIQKLAPSRWEDYKQLRLESLKESPLAFGSAFEEEAKLGVGEWKKRMKNTYFAMTGDIPVGMIVCSFNKEVKFRHIAEIYSFYVRAGYRGRGIGKALLGHALRLAKNSPRTIKVRLYVNSQQWAAVKMYRIAGFAVVGRLVREMKVGERFYTMLVMEKRIR
jgi:ribosomal protein S18 acetylase RimI-like enzyme